jgi:hypothetical protein
MATRKTPRDRIYKVIFLNQGRVFEIYARSVGQGSIFGFIEVEQWLFGERSSVVVDPSEESLKTEFAGVKRTFIPLHAVVRIDEVEKPGTARIVQGEKEGGKLSPFPMPVQLPGKDTGKS